MRNQNAAIMRRLSDPDFQASLVNKSITLVMGMFVLVLAFGGLALYAFTHMQPPNLYITDGLNQPRPVRALSAPIVDDTQIKEWAVRAVLGVYNVNYHDYPVQLNTAGTKFTQNGWKSFADAYIKSGNYDAMKKAMLLCDGQTQRAAIIKDTTLFHGALAYQIEVPIVQTCRNSNQTSTQRLLLTALVVRTNDEAHPDGLAVEQLVAKPM